MERSTMTTSKPISATTSNKDVRDPTLFIVVHNIHHMRLEFPPPPNHIIPTTIWDRLVAKLRMLGLKFIYKSTGNVNDGKFYEFEREQEGNDPVVVHHEYNVHTGEFKHAKDGTQTDYGQETDPILGNVITFPEDRNFVQEKIYPFIQQKARDVIKQQQQQDALDQHQKETGDVVFQHKQEAHNEYQQEVHDVVSQQQEANIVSSQYQQETKHYQSDMVFDNSETFPESVTGNAHIIVAVFLFSWIFISIVMIRSYVSYYHKRTSIPTQTHQQDSPYNASGVKLTTSNTRHRRLNRTEIIGENHKNEMNEMDNEIQL